MQSREMLKEVQRAMHPVCRRGMCVLLPTRPVQHAMCRTVRLGAVLQAMQEELELRSPMPIYLWR
jgi:hypothetical protein